MVVLGPKDMEHATAEDEVVFAPGALGQRSSDAGRARTRAARKGFAAAALVHAHLDSRLSDVGKLDIGLLGEYGVRLVERPDFLKVERRKGPFLGSEQVFRQCAEVVDEGDRMGIAH